MLCMRRFCPCLAGRGKFSAQGHVDVHFLGYFENEDARVLQSPFHIRDNKVCFGSESAAVNVDLLWHAEIMGCAVKCKDAGDLNDGVTSRGDGSVVFLWSKGDFRVMFNVQNILVHLFVAAGFAAVSAACCDDN